MTQTIITVNNISKSFGEVCAVRGLSFAVEPAVCFGFLGPNGAGKTTMMKMIYGKCLRDRDCGGSIDIFGFDPRDSELQIKYFSGVVPQENNLDTELDVENNLILYSKFYDMPSRKAKERIAELLEFMELTEKTNSKIKDLSGGMKRRLIIARALLNEPKLLILDEPTTGLDPQVRHLIWDKLRQLKKSGTTILLTTHYMEEAFQLCDSLLIMDKGRKIMEGTPRQLVSENIEGFVIEIHSEEGVQSVVNKGVPNGVRVDDSWQTLRLFANDMEPLKSISDTLQPGEYHLRQANLEDVFLKATGRSLNVLQ